MTKVVVRTVLRKLTGEWIFRSLMARLREIGLDFVETIGGSDDEPALMGLVESWGGLRATRRGPRVLAESTVAGSSKSNGIVERATVGARDRFQGGW